ncbi:MAG: hypothetical protein CBE46_000945 [Candidatus Pelagibacter sp. TMED286]|nr:MAG: hypothetical protein CBE46_000945 [Candidatus Pelagibacter sp. TMED286]
MNKILLNLDTKKFFYTLLILNSFLFTFYSGLRGVFPLDSFLIFDAGYKIINNLHPFKDYWSITGPFLDYIQAFLFSLLNVSWSAYIFHAFLLNTAVSLVAFYFFNLLGLRNFFSFIYSLSISILAYPSAGTPFMDHHATILSLIAIIYLILGLKTKNNLYWFILPILLGFSFFSKQVPAAFFCFFFTIILFSNLYFKRSKNLNPLIYFIYGVILFVFLVVSLILINEIPIKNILVQYFFYPLSIGSDRSNILNLDINNVILQFKLIYISIIPLIISGFYIFKKKNNFSDILIFTTVITSLCIFIYSQLLTKNQVLIFFLIPFYLGMSHYFANKYLKKKYTTFFLLFILIISTVKFHQRFNIEKKFMELNNVDFKTGIDGGNLDIKFKGLNWISPNYPKNPSKEIDLLKDTKEKIINEKYNKIIITDYQILPYLTKSKIPTPNKWFDNLSVPKKNNKYFIEYKEFFVQKLKKEEISVIFIVGKKKDVYLENIFPKADCMIKTRINELSKKIDIRKCFN